MQFSVEHPEHFRAMSVPGLFDKTPPEQRERQNAWAEAQRAAIIRAQEVGEIAAIPIESWKVFPAARV